LQPAQKPHENCVFENHFAAALVKFQKQIEEAAQKESNTGSVYICLHQEMMNKLTLLFHQNARSHTAIG
jgi:hypothetical protein